MRIIGFVTLLFESSLAAYSLTKQYSSTTFFDGFDYYGHYDNLTNGDVNYVTREQGMNASNPLTYINSAGNAIIKVDNVSTVPYNEKRNSVRLTSTDQYDLGSLIIIDMLHSPYGCSVWPAFWMQGDPWPANGEVDMFEGVNLRKTNQVALHTTSGCSYTNSSALSANQTGILQYGSCNTADNYNSGCTVLSTDTSSYGSGLAAAGGGVYATQFSRNGIAVWFFPRSSIPTDLQDSSSASPNPAGWGTPQAFYSSSTCDIESHFGLQRLLFTITLCGDLAGNSAIFNETCTGTCYVDYVLNSTNYDQAYFEVSSVRVYTDPSLGRTSNSSSSSTTTTGTSASNKNIGGIVQASIVAVVMTAAVSVLIL